MTNLHDPTPGGGTPIPNSCPTCERRHAAAGSEFPYDPNCPCCNCCWAPNTADRLAVAIRFAEFTDGGRSGGDRFRSRVAAWFRANPEAGELLSGFPEVAAWCEHFPAPVGGDAA